MSNHIKNKRGSSSRFAYLLAIVLLATLSGIVDFTLHDSELVLLLLQPIGLACVLFYVLSLYLNHPSYIISSAFQIYIFLGLLVSLIFSAHGVYMFEVEAFGSPNFAFWVCSVFCLLGFESGLAGFRSASNTVLSKMIPPRFGRDIENVFLYIVPSIMLMAAVVILLTIEGPVLLGINRITFWQVLAPSWLERFPSAFGQSFFLIAFLWFANRERGGQKLIPAALLVGYLLSTALVLGEKFSVFVLYFIMWCSVWSGGKDRHRISARLILTATLLFFALITLVVVTYLSQGQEVGFILQRVALQAELLWSVMNENPSRLLAGGDWECMFGCGQFASGTEFISARYMPEQLFERYQSTGSGLTGFMPSLPILLYGIPFALFLHVLISYVIGAVQWYLVKTVQASGVVCSIIVFKIYYGLTVSWYTMNFYPLTGVAVAILLLLVILVLPRSISRRGELNTYAG